jgi:hypothetical protein
LPNSIQAVFLNTAYYAYGEHLPIIAGRILIVSTRRSQQEC